MKDESGTQLGIDFLEKRYTTKTIHYFDIEANYRPLPQVAADDCAQMASAFLLYLLGAFLFANGRQPVSLRWLALFHYFKEARKAN